MRALELFSGIGGMHFALKECGIPGEIVLAVDINPVANEIYHHNFPEVKLMNRNIQSLSANFLNSFEADTILMSPPCQPFTRNGLKCDIKDPRAEPLLHILDILPDLNVSNILLENVKGFETSHMRDHLVRVLEKCSFTFQEFLLSPTQFGIPNSRLRYYCLAKKSASKFQENLEPLITNFTIPEHQICSEINNILESDEVVLLDYMLPIKLLKRYWKVLDICYRNSRRSCCFTKAYGRYAEGTGSVLSNLSENECNKILQGLEQLQDVENEDFQEKLLNSLQLRYFTPIEISRLLSFPSYFSFPDHCRNRQKYMVLGNSINIHVVSSLIKLLQ